MESFNKPISRYDTDTRKWDNPRIRLHREDIVSFSIADADYPTAPAIREALETRVRHGIFGYTYAGDSYYDAVIGYAKRHWHYDVKAEWIVKAPTVLTTLALFLRLFTEEGDSIAVQPPVYNPFFQIVNRAKRKLVYNPLLQEGTSYRMDFAHLESLFKNGTKMMILCSPHNPVGRVWSYRDIQRITDLARAYHVILFSDEIHCDLILEGHEFTSVGCFVKEDDPFIISTAPTKTFNMAGLLISNAIIPNKDFRNPLAQALEDLAVSEPNALALAACQAAYTNADEWLKLQMKHLQNNLSYAVTYFHTHLPEVKTAVPEGTYLLWIDMRYLGFSSADLVQKLEDCGVIVNAGNLYGEAYDGFIRMNCACPLETLKEGLRRIHAFTSRYEKVICPLH